jgi:DNA-directed RNA polymerase subunit beta
MVSVATALIPFLEHDDANRALMGANMQRQAVPLLRSRRRSSAPAWSSAPPSTPATSSPPRRPASSPRSRPTRHGRVQDDGTTVLPAAKFRAPTRAPASTRSRSSTRATARRGRRLADGPSTDQGEMALGKNLLVAFMPWEGYNYEDAIILSSAS